MTLVKPGQAGDNGQYKIGGGDQIPAGWYNFKCTGVKKDHPGESDIIKFHLTVVGGEHDGWDGGGSFSLDVFAVSKFGDTEEQMANILSALSGGVLGTVNEKCPNANSFFEAPVINEIQISAVNSLISCEVKPAGEKKFLKVMNIRPASDAGHNADVSGTVQGTGTEQPAMR